MSADIRWLRGLVREIPDFPSAGIVFRDITPLLADVDGFRFAVDCLADHFAGSRIDQVVGIEARGFILAAPVAYRFGAGFVPVRKAGKLPWETTAELYSLEYGEDRLEIHNDAVPEGSQVLIVDDVLATGGTAAATAALIERSGAHVAGMAFLVEITGLGGRRRLEHHDVMTMIEFD